MTAKRPKLWWVYLDQQVHGPFTLEQIGQMPGIGERTRICLEGTQDWTTLGQLATTAESRPEPEQGRRCGNCSRRTRPGAKYCEHCGTILGDSSEPASQAGKGGAGWGGKLLALAALALVAGGAAYSWKLLEARRRAQEPTGRVTIAVEQVVHTRELRDVRGEARTPLPGKRFCLVTLSVRNPDATPALFNRAQLRWIGAGGRTADLDGLTPFLPNELLATPRLEPGTGIQGRVVFQVPESMDRFVLHYGAAQIPVPAALLEADRRWRGRDDVAMRAVRAFKCRGADGKPIPLDPNTVLEARQELGALYHVDAEDLAFHVDLANARVFAASDVETLIAENTRRDCFGGK